MSETLYKVLLPGGRPVYATGLWYLPKGGRPGRWMPRIKGDLVPCENGYHLCRLGDLPQWLEEELFTAEYRGDMVPDEDKIVVRQARLLRKLTTWNPQTMRLFACDCAERAFGYEEIPVVDAGKIRDAIEISRAYAGDASREEALEDACQQVWRHCRRTIGWEAVMYAVAPASHGPVNAGGAALRMQGLAAWWATRDIEHTGSTAQTAWAPVWPVNRTTTGYPETELDAAREWGRNRERRWQAARLAHYLYGDTE